MTAAEYGSIIANLKKQINAEAALKQKPNDEINTKLDQVKNVLCKRLK